MADHSQNGRVDEAFGAGDQGLLPLASGHLFLTPGVSRAQASEPPIEGGGSGEGGLMITLWLATMPLHRRVCSIWVRVSSGFP